MQPAIRVSQVRSFRDGPQWVASARVEHPLGVDELWFRSDTPLPGPAADAALMVTQAWALRFGVPLQIDAPVCPVLLENIARLHEVLCCWRPRWRRVPVEATARAPSDRPPTGPSRAAFFSGGVDSFHTVLRGGWNLDTLINVLGMDVRPEDTELTAAATANWSAVADALGLRLVLLRSNLRQIHDQRGPRFRMYPGGLSAAVSLLAGDVGVALFSAVATFNGLVPDSIHPVTVPMLDTAYARFVYAGGEVSRLGKVRALAEEPLAMDHLHVCFCGSGKRINCGECFKCVRTMLALQAVGAIGRCRTLPGTLDPRAVRAGRIDAYRDIPFYLGMLEALRRRPEDRAVYLAARHLVRRAQGRTLSRRLRALARPAAAVLGRSEQPQRDEGDL
ncbi:MAG: hypothetical protein KIT68_11475 [Phycisphaeraceae bacterium]|nr:hypothetical protein [Phycisphaeraceae bacterium]